MRLIDADELIERTWRWAVNSREAVQQMIKGCPTIDAVPVNWIEDYLEQIHEDLDYARQDNDEEAMKRIFRMRKDDDPPYDRRLEA